VLNADLASLHAHEDEAIRPSDAARRRRCGPRPHEARTPPRRTEAVRHCGEFQTLLHDGGRLIVICTATIAGHAPDSSREPQAWPRRTSRSGATRLASPAMDLPSITAGRRAVIWSVDGASQSSMAYWMVVSSVYSCIVPLGVNIRICRGQVRAPGHGTRPWPCSRSQSAAANSASRGRRLTKDGRGE
jgi:hypothetical protein